MAIISQESLPLNAKEIKELVEFLEEEIVALSFSIPFMDANEEYEEATIQQKQIEKRQKYINRFNSWLDANNFTRNLG